ncbi:MAG: DNA-binding protein, partial [Vulcanisaeta sp.]
MGVDIDDVERRRIMMKMMMEMMNKAQQKTATKRELTRNEVIQLLKQMTKGERANEIIDNALQLYGDTAVQVFKQL